jgi:hypothetical protein
MVDEVPSRSELIEKFETDENSCFDFGATNNVTDITLTIISVFASLAATVLVAVTGWKIVAASVAAIPAACTSLQRIIDFRGRSHWYFQHSAASKHLRSPSSMRRIRIWRSSPNVELTSRSKASSGGR